MYSGRWVLTSLDTVDIVYIGRCIQWTLCIAFVEYRGRLFTVDVMHHIRCIQWTFVFSLLCVQWTLCTVNVVYIGRCVSLL